METLMLPLLLMLVWPAFSAASSVNNQSAIFLDFHSWATSHSKPYLEASENECLDSSLCNEAYTNYISTDAYIVSHPASSSFNLGHSQFSDLLSIPDNPFLPTPPIYNPDGDFPVDFPVESSSPFTQLLDALKSLHAPSPTPIDWSTSNNPKSTPLVPHVINQGLCGSCYAISSMSTTLTNYWLTSSSPPTSHQVKSDLLSTQQILDCSPNNLHCVGGNPIFSYIYAETSYITLEKFYPYTSSTDLVDKTCLSSSIHGGIKVDAFTIIPSSPPSIKAALQTGTVTAGIEGTSKDLLFYKSGVYTGELCTGKTLNHAVVITGWGVDPGTSEGEFLQ
mmetsp:Transcript_10696/g.19358  ORF Transcript_10696/g.19358 Transcript_10696/m.19358 type:complete len:335 (+) Transcript_10696:169-1173(+)